eukprot:2376103-Pleurochrysis_carterae.AAC.2
MAFRVCAVVSAVDWGERRGRCSLGTTAQRCCACSVRGLCRVRHGDDDIASDGCLVLRDLSIARLFGISEAPQERLRKCGSTHIDYQVAFLSVP